MKPRSQRATPPQARPDLVSVAYVHPGHLQACFAASLKDLVIHDLGTKGRLAHPHGEMAKECGSGGIAMGRNTIAKVIVDESQARWLFLVDSDAGFAEDTLERLLAVADPTERPIVGALSFGATHDGKASHHGVRHRAYPTLMMWYDLEDRVGFAPMTDYPPDAVVPVSATGCHCLLIHRTVLERIRARFGDTWFDPMRHPRLPATQFSEDLSFCLRAAACDIPVHVHTGVKTTHDKGFAFLDEEWFVAQEIAAGRRPAPQAEEASCPQPASA